MAHHIMALNTMEYHVNTHHIFIHDHTRFETHTVPYFRSAQKVKCACKNSGEKSVIQKKVMKQNTMLGEHLKPTCINK